MPEPARDVRKSNVFVQLVSFRWIDVDLDEIGGKRLLRITYQRPTAKANEAMKGDSGISHFELVYVDVNQVAELLRIAVEQREYANAKLLEEALRSINVPETTRVLGETAGSLRLVVPVEIASYIKVQAGDRVRFVTKGGKVVLEPVREENSS